jgi:hypothetical protein
MNGSFYTKRTSYTDNTFALYSDKALTTPVAGNGTYGGSPTMARCFRLKGILRTAGGSGYLTKLRLLTNSVTFLDQIRVHVYNSPLAVVADQSAYTLLWANRLARLGYVDMPALTTEGAGSDAAYSLATSATPTTGIPTNLPLEVHNAETVPDTDLWVRFEDMGTGTPAAGQTFFLEATVDCN